MKKVLFAVDLEGVNLVQGEEYQGLVKNCEQWEVARRQAAKEINAGAEALFSQGVEKIALWDNHGGGNNIDVADLDKRIEVIACDNSKKRMYFGDEFDCVCFFGYHAMEGTLGGVLAHTMSSVSVQYYKLNGKYIGEVDMDAYIAASHNLSCCFFAGGDIACAQAQKAILGITTVTTKKELSRNSAIFRDNEELLAEIKEKIVKAVNSNVEKTELSFPAKMEKAFKRTEDAARYLARLKELGICADYPKDEILGFDAHSVEATVNNIDEFISCI